MIPVFANPFAQHVDIPPDISQQHRARLKERIIATGKETQTVVQMAVDYLLGSLMELVDRSLHVPFVTPLIFEYWNSTVCDTNFLNRLELSLVNAIRKEHQEVLDGFTHKVSKDILSEFEGEQMQKDIVRSGFRQLTQDFKTFVQSIEITKVQDTLRGLFPEYPESEIVRFRKVEDLVLRRKFKAKLVCEPFLDVKQHHQSSDVSLFRTLRKNNSVFVSAFTNSSIGLPRFTAEQNFGVRSEL